MDTLACLIYILCIIEALHGFLFLIPETVQLGVGSIGLCLRTNMVVQCLLLCFGLVLVFLCSLGCPGTHPVHQAGFKRYRYRPDFFLKSCLCYFKIMHVCIYEVSAFDLSAHGD